MLGFGAMLHMLAGDDETPKAYKNALGKTIKALGIDEWGDDRLLIHFTDDTTIAIYDDGRSCCESRYMHTDDDLKSFIGATFMGAEVRDGGSTEGDWDVHEIEFLVVNTSLGAFTVETHNIHNGYYGGFAIQVREV